MYNIVQTIISPEKAYEDSHFKKTVQVFRMYHVVQTIISPEKAYENSHWIEFMAFFYFSSVFCGIVAAFLRVVQPLYFY